MSVERDPSSRFVEVIPASVGIRIGQSVLPLTPRVPENDDSIESRLIYEMVQLANWALDQGVIVQRGIVYVPSE